ncbi:MAG TPA: hypothetical protein VK444_00010 [Methanobacteriaceae archaeon]|nr:hypothetical protein [Methanobacteriaceae archaeon]
MKDNFRQLADKISSNTIVTKQSQPELWQNGLFQGANCVIKDAEKWANFQIRYRTEIDRKIEVMMEIRKKKREKLKVTWIYDSY